MWCIGRITAEYRERMYDLLGLYAKPYDPSEPVVCLDESQEAGGQNNRWRSQGPLGGCVVSEASRADWTQVPPRN